MAYTSWSVVFGEQPSASKWNILGTNDASFNDGSGIADGAVTPDKWVNNTCLFSVYRNAAQSVNGTAKISFDTEDYDVGGDYDSATNYRFDAPFDGYYHFNLQVNITDAIGANANNVVMARLYKNGSLYARGTNGNTYNGRTGSCVVIDMHLSAGDYIEGYAYTNVNMSLQVGSTYRSVRLDGHLIHKD